MFEQCSDHDDNDDDDDENEDTTVMIHDDYDDDDNDNDNDDNDLSKALEHRLLEENSATGKGQSRSQRKEIEGRMGREREERAEGEEVGEERGRDTQSSHYCAHVEEENGMGIKTTTAMMIPRFEGDEDDDCRRYE